MVSCLQQGNIHIKRKLLAWRVRKCILLVGVKTALTCAGRQTTPSQMRKKRSEKGNLRILGWTYRHGTVFAQWQYLYQKESTGMESLEMHFLSGAKTALTCAGRVSTPSQGRRYGAEKGNLCIVG